LAWHGRAWEVLGYWAWSDVHFILKGEAMGCMALGMNTQHATWPGRFDYIHTRQ
jgi:hypothetical protein